jgi:polysaccharide biosynthesis protein PslG
MSSPDRHEPRRAPAAPPSARHAAAGQQRDAGRALRPHLRVAASLGVSALVLGGLAVVGVPADASTKTWSHKQHSPSPTATTSSPSPTATTSSPSPTATSSSPVASPSPTSAAVSSGLVAGVNDHPVWLNSSQSYDVSLMAAAHAKAVRIDVPWNVVDGGSKGTYNSYYLGHLDTYVNLATAAGIDVLMVVTNAPQWANGSTDPHVPPINNADYADFLQFLMNRYAGKVHEYEIWNEPNGGWAWTNPDPVRYESLLQAAYTRAKAVDPTVTILAPSLSGPDQASYLDKFYAAGAKNYFDAFSMHGYWFNINGSTVLPYWNASNPAQSIFGAFTTRILPVMTKYGDQAKPVWWTETGASTQGSITTTTDQAAMVDQAFTAFKAHVIPTMTRLYWYGENDGIGTGSEQNYGLVDLTGTTAINPAPSNFTPKPAYTNYQNDAAGL